MSEQIKTAIPDIGRAKEFIAQKLAEAGFTAFEEFSSVDSLIYKDKQIAFYSLKAVAANASCLNTKGGKSFTQIDCVFEMKLMGVSSDNASPLALDDSCQALYMHLLNDSECIVRFAELGNAERFMPLKRLARKLKITLRLCVSESFGGGYEKLGLHRAVLNGNIVIYPHSLDISAKARKTVITTADGRLITKPIDPEPAKITIKGRFAPDEREYYFKLAQELSASKGITLELDGAAYQNVLPCECKAQVKDGELLGEYDLILEGRAYEL